MESVRGAKKWREPTVALSSVQWSHQEASGVCEALLSQRIPSPSSTHTRSSPTSPPLSILLSHFPASFPPPKKASPTSQHFGLPEGPV